VVHLEYEGTQASFPEYRAGLIFCRSESLDNSGLHPLQGAIFESWVVSEQCSTARLLGWRGVGKILHQTLSQQPGRDIFTHGQHSFSKSLRI
jgi:hypothetical protein